MPFPLTLLTFLGPEPEPLTTHQKNCSILGFMMQASFKWSLISKFMFKAIYPDWIVAAGMYKRSPDNPNLLKVERQVPLF